MLKKIRKFFSFGIVGLTLACFSVTLLPNAAHAVEKFEPNGRWHGFVADEADEVGFGISADADDGGTVALVVQNGDVALMMTSPDWRMRVGERLPVRVTINGESYSGDARIIKKDMIKLSGISNDLVLRFAHGNQAKINIGRNGLAWKLALDGFAQLLQNTVKAFARRDI